MGYGDAMNKMHSGAVGETDGYLPNSRPKMVGGLLEIAFYHHIATANGFIRTVYGVATDRKLQVQNLPSFSRALLQRNRSIRMETALHGRERRERKERRREES